MRLLRLVIAAAFVSLTAQAADRAVHLQVPQPVLPDVAAMPLIAGPTDDAERRINTALQRLDATVRKAAGACKDSDGKSGWQRSVDATMRGPGFVSLLITDTVDCGGAHPDSGVIAIVYDLRTGTPVDWTKLLPPGLTGVPSLDSGEDGTKTVRLASARLTALYRAGIHYGTGPNDTDPSCKDALEAEGPLPMSAWLDAKAGGLAVQPDLAHVVQACADPVVISTAALRQEGANAQLTGAIDAAHRPH